MNPHRLTAAKVVRARKASACRRWRRFCRMPTPSGRPSRWRGMTDRCATCKSLPPVRSGFTLVNQPLPIRWVLVRDPQGDYDPVGLLSTDPTAEPLSIVTWFVQRWQLEVTFEEARRHLGVETQRQWSDKAIARTTPLLLGLFSWVTLVAHALYTAHPSAAPRQAVWYPKAAAHFLRCSRFGASILCGRLIRLFEYRGKNPIC